VVDRQHATSTHCRVCAPSLVALGNENRKRRVNDGNSQLVLVVTATYKGAVGYADVFDCAISRVVAGTLDERRVQLSILAGDRDTLRFISEHPHPAQLEIRFTVNRKGEPYAMSPVSGFVDKSRTSWKIESIREVKE
jgi:hypothetical protein